MKCLDEKFRQGFSGTQAADQESENKEQVPLLALRSREGCSRE